MIRPLQRMLQGGERTSGKVVIRHVPPASTSPQQEAKESKSRTTLQQQHALGVILRVRHSLVDRVQETCSIELSMKFSKTLERHGGVRRKERPEIVIAQNPIPALKES